MQQIINFKIGDTFSISGQLLSDAVGSPPINMTDYTLRSQIRNNGQVVQSLAASVTDAVNGAYSLTATPAQTVLWPVGTSEMDIEFTSNTGAVTSTETIYINCKNDVTK